MFVWLILVLRVLNDTDRWILSSIFLTGVLAECPTPVELNVEFIIVPPSTVDVDTVRVIGVARRVEQATERTIKSYSYFHIVVLAFCFNIWKIK